VAGLLVRAVADGGHHNLALEAAADAVIDTLGLAPALGPASYGGERRIETRTTARAVPFPN
jgi:hypothetical protein